MAENLIESGYNSLTFYIDRFLNAVIDYSMQYTAIKFEWSITYFKGSQPHKQQVLKSTSLVSQRQK